MYFVNAPETKRCFIFDFGFDFRGRFKETIPPTYFTKAVLEKL